MSPGEESGPGNEALAVLRCRDGSMMTLPVRAAPHWPPELRVTVQPETGFAPEWSDVSRPVSVSAHVFRLAQVDSDRRALYDELP